jgi:hypothetical protein
MTVTLVISIVLTISVVADTRVSEYLARFGCRKLLRCGCNDFYARDGD